MDDKDQRTLTSPEIRDRIIAAVVAVAVVIGLGILTNDPWWAGVINRGVASGAAIAGFIAAVGGLVTGSQALRQGTLSYTQVGASSLAAVAGAALVLVGTVSLRP